MTELSKDRLVANKKDGSMAKTGGLFDVIKPLVSKVREIDPKSAKGSAVRGAASSKELASLSVAYLKQETKQPLQGLQRYLSYGIAAAVLLAFGSVLLMLGILRAVQAKVAYVRSDSEGVVRRGHWSGNLTWLPYVVVFALCVALIGLLAYVWSRGSRRDAQRSEGLK